MILNYVEIAVIAIMALFIIVGIFKGFWKPFMSLIGWGISVASIYFFGGKLANLINPTSFGNWIRGFVGKIIENVDIVEKVTNYIILGIVAVAIVLVVSIIVAIINIILKNSLFMKRKGFWDRFFGALLYIVKGALFVFIVLALLMPILDALKQTEIINMINEGKFSRYLVEYNPITLLFQAILN